LKGYKSLSIDRITAELIQAGGNILHTEIYIFGNSILSVAELPEQWKESVIIVPVYKKQ
jgi:hypothetical protein